MITNAKSPRLFLVGPFPHGSLGGVSFIQREMEDAVTARGIKSRRIDISGSLKGRGLLHYAVRLGRAFVGFFKILLAPGRYTCLISLDGGAGLYINMAMALAARARGFALIFYHHSTHYLFEESRALRWLLAIAGRDVAHVACSPVMCTMLQNRYGGSQDFMIVSNVAWVAPPATVAAAPEADSRLTLGFLSVLSEKKGVFRAIETLRELRRRHVPARLRLAGGGQTSQVQSMIDAACIEFGADLEFLGGVYDPQAKRDFFASLDFFLFPTLYPHETQSLVVPEAMAAGVAVIAFDHRFVGELVGEGGGLLIAADQDFPAVAATWITQQHDRQGRSAGVRRHYAQLREQARSQIEALMARLRR